MSAPHPRISVLCALPLVGLVACATYTERTERALRDFQGGQFDPALRAYADPETTGSAFLAGAEAGTVALTAGDWQSALEHYHLAAAVVEDYWKLLMGEKASGEAEFVDLWRKLKTDDAYHVEAMLHRLIRTEAYGVP